MLAVVFDENLQSVARKRRKTRTNEGEPVSLERLSETIVKALEESAPGLMRLQASAVACLARWICRKASSSKLRIWAGRMLLCRTICQRSSAVRL
jgi:hypothetical protein